MTSRRVPIAMWLAVSAVAAFGAIISYRHIYALGRHHGGDAIAAPLLPLSVDGLIVAASVLLLHEAMQRRRAPIFAYVLLGSGIAATIGANIIYGLPWGILGAIIWAWPSYAFVGCIELLAMLLRRTGHEVADTSSGTVSTWVPESSQHAAQLAFEASMRGGNPLSQNALTTRFGISRTEARQIRAALNGIIDGG